MADEQKVVEILVKCELKTGTVSITTDIVDKFLALQMLAEAGHIVTVMQMPKADTDKPEAEDQAKETVH